MCHKPVLMLLRCPAHWAGVMDAVGPKPAAANQGTLISVEDLFFNVPLRRKVAGRGPLQPVFCMLVRKQQH